MPLSASLGQGRLFQPSAVGIAGGVQVLVFGQDPWRSPRLGLPIGLAFAGAEPQASKEASGSTLDITAFASLNR